MDTISNLGSNHLVLKSLRENGRTYYVLCVVSKDLIVRLSNGLEVPVVFFFLNGPWFSLVPTEFTKVWATATFDAYQTDDH